MLSDLTQVTWSSFSCPRASMIFTELKVNSFSATRSSSCEVNDLAAAPIPCIRHHCPAVAEKVPQTQHMIPHITFSYCSAILLEQIKGLSRSREKGHGHV